MVEHKQHGFKCLLVRIVYMHENGISIGNRISKFLVYKMLQRRKYCFRFIKILNSGLIIEVNKKRGDFIWSKDLKSAEG